MKWMDGRGRTGRGLKPVPTVHEEESEQLDDEVKRRAGEMCMPMLLKSQARRQQLRYGDVAESMLRGVPAQAKGCDAAGPPEMQAAVGHVEKRGAVCGEAAQFTE